VLLPDPTSGPERTAYYIQEQTGLSCARLSNVSAVEAIPQSKPDARERILDTAYELFSRRAIRDVGVDELIEQAGVAKATLYRHFPSKDDLVIAFLERRQERWTLAWVEAEARRRGTTPEEQLLAIFELFDEWFQREDFEACSFINVLLELGLDTLRGAPACAIWRTSARSSEASPRKPVCAILAPSLTRGTSS
jgi:AcrR family transcriptional regulator